MTPHTSSSEVKHSIEAPKSLPKQVTPQTLSSEVKNNVEAPKSLLKYEPTEPRFCRPKRVPPQKTATRRGEDCERLEWKEQTDFNVNLRGY